MKKYALLFLATVWLIGLYSCLDCRDVECPDGDSKLLFILSKVDSSDLILGGQYLLDSLTITPILIDTTKSGARTRIEPGFDNTYYNTLIWADNNTSGYIIQLDSLPPDTLLVTTMPSKGDGCCSSITEFDKLLLNGDSIFNDYSVYAIKIYK